MVSFDPTSYGLRLSFVGGTSAQNVSDCIADTGGQFASMPKGWRLLVDVREAPLMNQSDFQRMSAFIAGFTNSPVKVAMLVGSEMFALQLERLYRNAGAGDRVCVFHADQGSKGLSEAERFVA